MTEFKKDICNQSLQVLLLQCPAIISSPFTVHLHHFYQQFTERFEERMVFCSYPFLAIVALIVHFCILYCCSRKCQLNHKTLISRVNLIWCNNFHYFFSVCHLHLSTFQLRLSSSHKDFLCFDTSHNRIWMFDLQQLISTEGNFLPNFSLSSSIICPVKMTQGEKILIMTENLCMPDRAGQV